MAFAPMTNCCEREGSRVRIHAAPKWVRQGGRWTPIEQACTVRQTEDGGFQIDCGDEWVRLVPHLLDFIAVRDATTRVLLRHNKFGPFLDPSLTPDTLRWFVLYSGGVTRTGRDSWEFASRDGVRLGLFLRQWTDRYGSDCQIDRDEITLDLRRAKAGTDSLLADGRINLDPSTVWAASHSGYLRAYGDEPLTWSDVRNLAVCRRAAARAFTSRPRRTSRASTATVDSFSSTHRSLKAA